MPDRAGGQIRRRVLLAGALGAALTTPGCSSDDPTPDEPATVASLTSTDPFYIGHRGGGANWPEMTGYAYEQASRVPGLRALEISVCLTADGVLVCSHDPTTTRVTGVPYVIAEENWDTLSGLLVTASQTRDPQQPARPLTRFDEVVERYIGTHVLFVEPKVSPAAGPLMDRMVAMGQPQRVVWKQPINSTRFAAAKARGFATWGYALDEPAHTGDQLARLAAASDIDLLGAPGAEPDAFAAAVVAAARANDKQTIMWEIGSPEQRTRASGSRVRRHDDV